MGTGSRVCPPFLLLIAVAFAFAAVCGVSNGDYLIGLGSYDMTGPAANVNMMGYANMEQNTAGVHFRLRARAFIVAEGSEGARFAFVNLDAGMASQLVTIKVLEKLRSRYGYLYNEKNLAISGTHTHAGPGGYLQYVVYSITSLGFVHQSFDAIVNAIEQSIVQAHNNLKPGSILINKGSLRAMPIMGAQRLKDLTRTLGFVFCVRAEARNLLLNKHATQERLEDFMWFGKTVYVHGNVENAGINRSPSAYLFNPAEERARYPKDVDPEMTLLKFVDGGTGESIGSFNWFATHGTSMSPGNRLISGDNKGAAARFFEDWFRNSSKATPSNQCLIPNTRNSLMPKQDASRLVETASKIKASGGQPCNGTTSRNFKVRKTSGSAFVGAFCQSNVGDVSPNVLGAFCIESGKPCDFNHSSCNGSDQLCIGRGPGYPDEILSTKIIGQRQFLKAVDLFNSAQEKLLGKIDYRHLYLNFTNINVDLGGNKVVRTCPAALGPGFAAGTTDGPGVFGFEQGDTKINKFWRKLRDFLKEPSQEQVECQLPKTVLLDTGEMFEPYEWAPAILPIQILRIGQLVILSVPGEFTTMAGRRLREAVKETLISNGGGEFNDQTHVVIAGLTNTYSQYIATFEEYKQQRYEAASTLYGPYTLSAYIQEFKKLATSMAKGEKPQKNILQPPDLSPVLISLLLEPLGDLLPQGKKFGDVEQDILLPSKRSSFAKGEKANATFWSGNPRHDLLTEGTFAVVEMLEGKQWNPVYDDDDFCLFFKWNVDNSSLYSLATVEWEIPKEAVSGVYRLRHFGSWKRFPKSPTGYFTGTSSAFAVS